MYTGWANYNGDLQNAVREERCDGYPDDQQGRKHTDLSVRRGEQDTRRKDEGGRGKHRTWNSDRICRAAFPELFDLPV